MRESQIAKRAIIDDLKEKFERCASFVIIDYKGLTVEKDTEFRAEFRKANVEYKVLKNTLVRIALNELGYKDFDAALNGPTAIAISYDDAIAPAKVVSEGIDKPIGRWFYPLGKYVYCALTLVALIAGAALGGIG